MKTGLVWITPKAEEVIMYCARVSNPANQQSTNTALLNYCLRNEHWSPFEMASACFEIETSRGIAPQILRHRSFSFQEFSLRYAKAVGFQKYEARRQDTKNRQNSIADMSADDNQWFLQAQSDVENFTSELYEEALTRGIAKEQARFLLPMTTTSRIYMSGTIRSWIHYLGLRTGNGTQKEHADIARSIQTELAIHLPNIAQTLEWTKENASISSSIVR